MLISAFVISPFLYLFNLSPKASVYKQKIYDNVDTVIGYEFANALYRGRRGALKVDLNLVNDVTEQTGGGGEPLNGEGSL